MVKRALVTPRFKLRSFWSDTSKVWFPNVSVKRFKIPYCVPKVMPTVVGTVAFNSLEVDHAPVLLKYLELKL